MTRLSAAPVAFAAVLGVAASASAFARAQPNDLPAAEEFQQDRATLMDEAHQSSHAAGASIDVLEDKAKYETGKERMRDENLASGVSLLKVNVDGDIDKLNKVDVDDWSRLRPVVQGDVSALNTLLKILEPVTHVQVPVSGAF